MTTRNFQSSCSSLENSQKRTNVIGLNGKPLKYRICYSILNLMRDCPHWNENENENFTLFTGDEIKSCLLLSKSQSSVILDSGCNSNVAGKRLLQVNVNWLLFRNTSIFWLEQGKKHSEHKMFRFSRGEIKKSLGQIIFSWNNSVRPQCASGSHVPPLKDGFLSERPKY